MKNLQFLSVRKFGLLSLGLILQATAGGAHAFWTDTANDLSTQYSADTLGTSTSDFAGTGYLSSNYKFDETGLPSGRNLTITGGGSTPSDPDIPFSFDDDGAGNNTVLLGGRFASTIGIDVTDRNYNEVAILFSAVGLNADPGGNNLKGQVTLNYVGGTSQTLLWDLEDSAPCCSNGSSLDAVTDLTVYRNGAQFTGRNWYYQTFAVDDTLLLQSIGLDSNFSGSDPGNDAEIGVYSISAFDVTPAPEGNIALLMILGLAILGYTRQKTGQRSA